MQFLNPFILFGLVASSIPLIIHLINKRKQKKIEFSTLKFIKELQNTRIRNVKLRQIILLILRTLLISFIVLAFARPTINNSIPGFVSYSSANTGVIIDNSFSMDVSDSKGNRLRQSRSIFESILNDVKDGDKLFVTQTNSQIRNNLFLSNNKSELLNEFKKIKIDESSNKINDIISQSNNLFEDNKELNNDLIIISDLQKNFIDGIDSNKLSEIKQINLIKVRDNYEIRNLSIDSVKLLTSIFQLNKNVDVEIYISNHSNSSFKDNIIAMSFNDRKVSQITFNIDANKNAVIKLSATANQTGAISAKLELENDDLLQDNNYYFAFIIPEIPKVLLLTEHNRSFVEIALRTRLDNSKLFLANSNQLATANLKDYDVIINTLDNFGELEKNRIKQYIESGGSLISFANNKIKDNFTFYQSLGFSAFKENDLKDKIKFNKVEKLHPLFSDLFLNNSDTKQFVESPEIEKMTTLSGGFVLIEANNQPFMNELKLGDGKIIYFAVSQDLNWSNFPLTGLFPALLNKSVIYLSADAGSFTKSYDNDKIILNIAKNKALDNNFTLISPAGQESKMKANSLPSGSVLIVDAIAELGAYTIKNSNNEYVAAFAINHNPKESETNYYSSDESKDILTTKFPNTKIIVVDNYEDFDLNKIRAEIGTELWQIFLILALLCGISELFVQKAYKNELE